MVNCGFYCLLEAPTTLIMKPRKKSEKDEFESLYEFFCEWTPVKDVFIIKYFAPFTSSASVLTGFYINNYFRKAVKLRNQGYISSFLPIVLIPSIFGTLSHFMFVMRPILMRETNCPICTEVRSGSIALASGIVYPSLLAPISAFLGANRYYTLAIPSVTQEPKECLKLAQKLYKPLLPTVFLFGAFQFLGGMMVAHMEAQNFATVTEKVSKMDSYIQKKKAERRKESYSDR